PLGPSGPWPAPSPTATIQGADPVRADEQTTQRSRHQGSDDRRNNGDDDCVLRCRHQPVTPSSTPKAFAGAAGARLFPVAQKTRPLIEPSPAAPTSPQTRTMKPADCADAMPASLPAMAMTS